MLLFVHPGDESVEGSMFVEFDAVDVAMGQADSQLAPP